MFSKESSERRASGDVKAPPGYSNSWYEGIASTGLVDTLYLFFPRFSDAMLLGEEIQSQNTGSQMACVAVTPNQPPSLGPYPSMLSLSQGCFKRLQE